MRLHTASRRDVPATGGAGAAADHTPEPRPLPGLGALLFVELPSTVTGPDAAVLYAVVSLDGAGDLTARPVVGVTPVLRTEMPCLVRPMAAPEDMFVDAFARTAHDGGLILHLDGVDSRLHRRYPLTMPVVVQPPGSVGMVGTTEDISLGGLRAHLPAPLPAVRRVFVSLTLPGSPPIVGTARMVSCERSDGAGPYLARVEYASMATADRARLWVLLDATANAERR
jgi:hypothetical protein